jgi:hypothetical protein
MHRRARLKGSFGDEHGCGSASCNPTFELGQSLLDQPRTLIISQKGQTQWGFGNLLPILLAYHTLCFAFRRKCIVQMMNTGFEKYYRYHNGQVWWHKSNFSIAVDKQLAGKGEALVQALQVHNSSTVIKVSLKHQPDFLCSSAGLEAATAVRRPWWLLLLLLLGHRGVVGLC